MSRSSSLFPNPDQPRRAFSEDALDELAASIREKGVIQPLIVRPEPPMATGYQIVAGERRWRAAQRAQVHEVPVIVRDFDDTEVLEVAIIENIQRSDLNPIEEAQGYRQLMDRFGHTQEQLAAAMGKSRSHIANLMRLLGLPDDVLEMLRDGRLTAGHARALITTRDPSALARQAVARGCRCVMWRSLRNLVGPVAGGRNRLRREKDADTRALEADLSAALGSCRVDHARPEGGGGKLTIKYNDLEGARRPDPPPQQRRGLRPKAPSGSRSAPGDRTPSSVWFRHVQSGPALPMTTGGLRPVPIRLDVPQAVQTTPSDSRSPIIRYSSACSARKPRRALSHRFRVSRRVQPQVGDSSVSVPQRRPFSVRRPWAPGPTPAQSPPRQ
jgi:ParB family chromosome partitioning protein